MGGEATRQRTRPPTYRQTHLTLRLTLGYALRIAAFQLYRRLPSAPRVAVANRYFYDNLVHYRQLVVTGSHDFTPHQFSTALKLIQYGIVRVAPLISHRFDLDAVRDAFEMAAGRGGLKSMVLPAA